MDYKRIKKQLEKSGRAWVLGSKINDKNKSNKLGKTTIAEYKLGKKSDSIMAKKVMYKTGELAGLIEEVEEEKVGAVSVHLIRFGRLD